MKDGEAVGDVAGEFVPDKEEEVGFICAGLFLFEEMKNDNSATCFLVFFFCSYKGESATLETSS